MEPNFEIMMDMYSKGDKGKFNLLAYYRHLSFSFRTTKIFLILAYCEFEHIFNKCNIWIFTIPFYIIAQELWFGSNFHLKGVNQVVLFPVIPYFFLCDTSRLRVSSFKKLHSQGHSFLQSSYKRKLNYNVLFFFFKKKYIQYDIFPTRTFERMISARLPLPISPIN